MRNKRAMLSLMISVAFLCSGILAAAQSAFADEVKAQVAMPKEYEGKHMPDGWWTDPKIIARGKLVYEGEVNKKVKCAKCHGVNGKPKAKGARDFRKKESIEKFSDTYWFFRVSEGVPKTLMKAWKGKISEDDIWAAMAYEHMFSNGGKPAEPDKSKWEPPKFQ